MFTCCTTLRIRWYTVVAEATLAISPYVALVDYGMVHDIY